MWLSAEMDLNLASFPPWPSQKHFYITAVTNQSCISAILLSEIAGDTLFSGGECKALKDAIS